MSAFTYAEIGGTRSARLPAGYNHLFHRIRIGSGADTFARASAAVLAFDMHRGAGAGIDPDAPVAAPGVRLNVTLGPFTVPCEVVYVVDQPDLAGFGYGTLPGHQETGEEAFLVERDAEGTVWLRVTAFSRPARWQTIAAGPLAIAVQHAFARLLGRSLRRICTVNP